MSSSGIKDRNTDRIRLADNILSRATDVIDSWKVWDESTTLSSLAGGGTPSRGQGSPEGNFMRRTDDIWLGPHGDQFVIVNIENGVINASNNTGADSSFIMINTESGAADNLDWIISGSDVLLFQMETLQTLLQNITFRPHIDFTITNIVGDGVTTTITVTVSGGSALATGDTIQISNTTNFNSDLVVITKTGANTFTFVYTGIGSAIAENSGDVDRGNIETPLDTDYISEPNNMSDWRFDTARQKWQWQSAFNSYATGGGGSGYSIIQDEGIALTQRPTMNFIGSGVTAVDNPGQSRTDITITGGGSVSYPLRPPIVNLGILSIDYAYDLTQQTGHKLKFTLGADLTLSFTGYAPNNFNQQWIVKVTQDDTTPYVITWPAEITNPPSSSSYSALGSTTLFVFDCDDNGTIVTTGNAVNVTAGGSQTPWLDNINANTFDLYNLDSLQFNPVIGSLSPAAIGITAIDSTGLRVQVVANGKFRVTEDDATIIPFEINTFTNIAYLNDTSINIVNTTNNDFLQFTSTDTLSTIDSNVNPISVAVAGAVVLQILSTGLVMQTKPIDGVLTLQMAALGQGLESINAGTMRLVSPTGFSLYSNDETFEFAQFGAENIGTVPIPFLSITEGEIIMSSIAVPPDSGDITIGKIFMDSTNSNHLSIKRLGAVIDLESGGGGSQTPWLDNINANTFDLYNLDSLTFMPTAGTLSDLNVGFSSLGSGGFRGNILNTGSLELAVENTVHFEFDSNGNTTITNALFSVLETVGGTSFQISKFADHTTLSDPVDLQFQRAGDTKLSLDSLGTNFNNSPAYNISQLGFGSAVSGYIIELLTNEMQFKVAPTRGFRWGDGTNDFATLDVGLFSLNAMPIRLISITSPGTTPSNIIGDVFMDSGNSNHLSIIRDGSAIDLESGSSGSLSYKITNPTGGQFDNAEVWYSSRVNSSRRISETGTLSEQFASTSPGVDSVFWVPIIMAKSFTITSIGVNTMQGVGTTTASFGMYESDPTTLEPTDLMVAANNQSIATPGMNSQNTGNVSRGPGLYYLAFRMLNSPSPALFTMSAIEPDGLPNVLGYDEDITAAATTVCFLSTYATGTSMPSTFALTSNESKLSGLDFGQIESGPPAVFIKVSVYGT